jgi:hypothetical protein
LESSKSRYTLPSIVTPLALVALGLASAWLYFWARDLHRFTQGIAAYISLFIGQFDIYLLACYVVLKRPAEQSRRVIFITITIVLLFAALFRAELVRQEPYLSTDTYRYLWDGHVQAAGINPYRYVPNAPELEHLRDNDIFPKINRADFAPTPYPPIAQAIYYLAYVISPLNLTAFKVMMAMFDLIGIIAVMLALARMGKDPALAIIYAWHPILIIEGAHTGHVESPFIALLALALLARTYQKPVLTGIAIGLAAMIKFYPALVLPAFSFYDERHAKKISNLEKRITLFGWLFRLQFNKSNMLLMAAFVATIVLSYLPYIDAGDRVFGYLPNEFKEEGYTDTGERYFLLAALRVIAPIPTSVFLGTAFVILAGLGLGWMIYYKRSTKEVARGAIALIGMFWFIATPRYAWYYAWILPFLCFAPRIEWIYLTGASVLLYLLWYIPNVYPEMPLWLGASLYVPTVLMLVWNYWRRKDRAIWL